ncbi:MAG: 50S ribosomal protein L4 [bacterium]|nr:50S ribosomal protein L4 [bacterium]
MISLDIYNINNEKIEQIEVAESVFDVQLKEHLLHDVVCYQQAKKRKGTASTKTRSEVQGSGTKPWRQKGTGRARAGCKRSPLWVGGGIVFGPHPRSYEFKLNKKVLNYALRSVISMKRREGDLIVLEEFNLEQPKTRLIKEIFDRLGIREKSLLVLDGEQHANLRLAARNLSNVKVIDTEGLNVYDILLYKKLIMLKSAAKKVEEKLSP